MSGNSASERRQHPRFALRPMFNAVAVHDSDDQTVEADLTGHAYDISESGIRVELDKAIRPGQAVSVSIDLPGMDEPVTASADVVWGYFDPIEPRTRRLAMHFTGFQSDLDSERLNRWLRSADTQRAA